MTLYLRRFLVLVLLVLSPLPVAARPAWACSCGGLADPLDSSETAFVGVAEDVDEPLFGNETKVRFAVESVLKGQPDDRVTLVTMNDSASCGYDFVEGGRYRVYANSGGTNLCAGNELLSTGHDTGGTDRTTIFWGGTALMLLLVTGGVTWLIRKS
jgi:hypothetical protein